MQGRDHRGRTSGPCFRLVSASVLGAWLAIGNAFPEYSEGEEKGVGAFECRDLTGTVDPGPVDYVTDIQAGIFDSEFSTCSGCHAAQGGLGGLGLAASVSYDQLVCAPTSTSTPGPSAGYRVVPFQPEESWLFLRINCFSQDNAGFRMPQFGSIVFTERQRQLYEWIRQGARPSLELPFSGGFESTGACPEL